MRKSVLSLLIIPSVFSCGGDAVCIIPPCPFPIAIDLRVRSGTSQTAAGAFVRVAGQNEMPCDGGQCYVSGYAGKYELDIGAPGFQTVHRTVQVTGKDGPKCGGCPTVDTQHVDIALVPVA